MSSAGQYLNLIKLWWSYAMKLDFIPTVFYFVIFWNRQQDQSEGTSALPEESGSRAVSDEENDQFWGLDDIPGKIFFFFLIWYFILVKL